MGGTGRVLLKVRGCVMVGLFMLWRSSVICKAKEERGGPPNLVHYADHFPDIIPDLSVFLRQQRMKLDMGISGSRGNHALTRSGGRRRERRRRRPNVSNEGLYVLDLYSRWDKNVEVWSHQDDEIDVVLRPRQGWIGELKQYKSAHMRLMASLPHKIKERPRLKKIVIRMEPFAGLSHQPILSRLWQVLRKLPCRFLRLSKWVFDTELGALAVIYVQVAKENVNLLARLALVHAPIELFQPPDHVNSLQKGNFTLWVYQNPDASKPVLDHQIDPQQLVATIQSLANHSSHHHPVKAAVPVGGPLPSSKHHHPYSLQLSDEAYNTYNQPLTDTDDDDDDDDAKEYAVLPRSEDREAAYILSSLKYQQHSEGGSS